MAKKRSERAKNSPIGNMGELFKKHQKNVSSMGAVSENVTEMEVLSTGSLSLDSKINYGGVPRGRITHIYGPERSLKTTIALKTMLNAFKKDPTCVGMFVDLEKTLDRNDALDFLRYLGFTEDMLNNQLLVVRDVPEKCFDVAEDFVQYKEAAVLIYIRSKALAQELIDGMNEDSIDLIKAKEEYEAIKAEALKILVDIGSAAAKVLFPMVLALI